MEELWWLLSGIAVGGLSAWLGSRIRRHHVVAHAEDQASEWISAAEEAAQQLDLEVKERCEELKETTFEKFERETRKMVQNNQNLSEKIEERDEHLKEQLLKIEQNKNRQEQIYKSRYGRLQSKDTQLRAVQQKRDHLKAKWIEMLFEKSGQNQAVVQQELFNTLQIETERNATKIAQSIEEEAEINLEREAKRIIQTVLNRFQRPYCSERGIGNVEFPNEDVKNRTLGPDRTLLKAIEKACGVDISVHDEYMSASVLGYDPVRRELGRLCLEKLMSDRQPSEQKIPQIVQHCKKELFKRIIQDGNKIERELRLSGFNEEIKHMLGALRYRYSFAQNQYFHCSEVGWLGGLLSSELGLDISHGRRAGVLHDIGKAMDHSKEGGHAVIGAEFIEQNGEQPEIVHAVRAHHFDETPNTDLAYLVIAADAISGARPGARRSTVDSYTQKIADLEKISSSFEGVIGTYILSAGREVRVIVDAYEVSDLDALNLSKKIVKKIEEEATYPGSIKVTVVRETHAIEIAK